MNRTGSPRFARECREDKFMSRIRALASQAPLGFSRQPFQSLGIRQHEVSAFFEGSSCKFFWRSHCKTR
eukprot:761652-Hanusia_phi.AAC.2